MPNELDGFASQVSTMSRRPLVIAADASDLITLTGLSMSIYTYSHTFNMISVPIYIEKLQLLDMKTK